MEALSAILFFVGLFFILYNLAINLANLTKIVNFCFETGSVDQYWSLFYEICVHRKALYSTVAAGIIGFITFIVITPFVIIKGVVAGKKIARNISSGAYFKYEKYTFDDTKFIHNNIGELGIEPFESTATGNIAIDLPLIMGYIQEACDHKSIKIQQNPIQYYDLSNKMQVQVPLIIETGEKVFPVYLIYTEQHKESFKKIGPLLKENHFENPLYFSILDMRS